MTLNLLICSNDIIFLPLRINYKDTNDFLYLESSACKIFEAALCGKHCLVPARRFLMGT